MGVRGTAGSTPAPTSHKPESSIFNTPSVVRPPSVLSDISKNGGGKEKPTDAPDTVKTLAKSVRVNGPTTSAVTRAIHRIEGLGHPPSAARKIPGLTRTPSRQSTIHSRSASTNPPSSTPTPKPAAHQRRVSNLDPVTPARPKAGPVSNGNPSPTLSEKENTKFLPPTKTPMSKASTTKRTPVPA